MERFILGLNIQEIIEKFKGYYHLKESPIAFFYTDDAPEEVFNPHPKSNNIFPCIIQFLNGVRRGHTLVLGRKSSHLCPGGLAYLGFKKMPTGIEYFLSTGMPNSKPGDTLLAGERFKKTPEIAKTFYGNMPFKKHPAEYAVFMPLEKVNSEKYKPDLIIFFVNMDQLGGLVQLFNYDTVDGIKVGLSSACGSVITEPLAEIGRQPVPRAVIGLLSDMFSRNHVEPEIASFTVTYDRLIQIYPQMDESFLHLESWQRILRRIKC